MAIRLTPRQYEILHYFSQGKFPPVWSVYQVPVFNRLKEKGFVGTDGDRYWLTRLGRQVYEEVTERKRIYKRRPAWKRRKSAER